MFVDKLIHIHQLLKKKKASSLFPSGLPPIPLYLAHEIHYTPTQLNVEAPL